MLLYLLLKLKYNVFKIVLSEWKVYFQKFEHAIIDINIKLLEKK